MESPDGSAYLWIDDSETPPRLHYRVKAHGKWWNATIPLQEETPELQEKEKKSR